MSIHYSGITNMVISPDNRLLFTTGADGSIFVFQIAEQIFNTRDLSLKPSFNVEQDTTNDKKGGQTKDVRQKIVDPELAEIVFVKKD